LSRAFKQLCQVLSKSVEGFGFCGGQILSILTGLRLLLELLFSLWYRHSLIEHVHSVMHLFGRGAPITAMFTLWNAC